MKRLKKYKKLIKHLPVNEHASSSKSEIWINNFENEIFYNFIFENQESIVISREEIKKDAKNGEIEKFILKSIIWAYPNGFTDSRNTNLQFLLESFDSLVINFKRLQNKKKLSLSDILDFPNHKGIGFATLSTLFYFFDKPVNGYKPLILDSKITAILRNSPFSDSRFHKLNKVNAPQKYGDYIKYMNELAIEFEVKEEEIEMFFSVFGKILK